MRKVILNWGAFNNATLAGMIAGCQNVYGDQSPGAMAAVDIKTFNLGLFAEEELILRAGIVEAKRLVEVALTFARK